MSNKQHVLTTYKQLIRALVKSSKRAKITQMKEDHKREIALLTYRKIGLVRQQASDPTSSSKGQNVHQLHDLTKRIQMLKSSDPSQRKDLHFYDNSSRLRQTIFQDLPSDESVLSKRLQHLSDLSGFVKNQLEYEQLVERYNPGLKMDQEEKVKRTAARVGLQVPDL
ncbi:LAME_0G12904g1_1 [Lachancea meyersii CBS 8951]|uniref:LAME_0G12904g1_1 n=1 Tax=Lachancea meyersii CBS 8951 TaxID=1266667 RepID=A0A1G4KA12_9SACH|nr:LAME_0G12904g1_1 [Lachancea meyersii CBS 8951]